MTRRYTRLLGRCLGLLLAMLASGLVARAQSGPYGNEWIVPTQTYYKIKVTQDGIYRLNHAYLTQAGLTGAVNPQRLQLWRRGQQVARYIGGNRNQLDATTYVEFFGQRNDGKLDRDMYLAASHQPHQLYSLFTDTAAYFLTVSATTNGRDMAENTSAAGTLHSNWVQQNIILDNGQYNYGQTDQQVAFLPWADTGEGFVGGQVGETRPPNVVTGFAYSTQTMSRRAQSGGIQAWLDYVIIGAYPNPHSTIVSVLPGGTGPARTLGVLNYGAYDVLRTRLPLQPSDFGTTNSLRVRQDVSSPVTPPADVFRVGYARVMYPQTAHWKAGRTYYQFWNDSSQAGAAYYELDSIPATVYGYNVADPYNVQRVTSTSISTTKRGFAFPNTIGRMRALVLADAAQPAVPAAAQAMQFRLINAASHNFIIVSNGALMRLTGSPQVNAVREYARYRASAAGGRHDTLVVTSDQLYDQFHYGERSPLAIKHFANYLLASPRADRYLLLLGKGVLITEQDGQVGVSTVYRQAPASQRALFPDLVPTSTRAPSDIFFTADWQNGSYVPRIPTGRVPATTGEQVLNYLNKLKQYEATGAEPWRKNILHMAGGEEPNEFARFQGYLRGYQRRAERAFFGANVENIYNTTNLLNGGTVSVDITPQLRRGLSLITYFGHGSTNYFDLKPTSIKDPASNYPSFPNGPGKYPVFYVNGCAAGNTYTIGGSIAEDWLLIANKGIIGFLADSDFGLETDQDRFSDQMYSALFNEPAWYGKPVAVVQAEVSRRMAQNIPPATNNQARRYYLSLLMNLTWQGDPALTLFAPEKPDYKFTPNATAAKVDDSAGPVLASASTFRLKLQLSNPGKIVSDSVRITVERTLGNNLLPGKVEKLHYYVRDTTVYITMTNPAGVSVLGTNTFKVRLDDPNTIAELDETNNSTTFTYNFLNGGVTLLQPTEFAIVGRPTVRLVGQSNLPQAQPINYEFELDTIPTFTSAFRRQSGPVSGRDIATWTTSLPTTGRDSLVYYWRFRFSPATATPGLDVSWATSSFRFINGSPGGWSQSHYGQMARNEKSRVTQAAPSGRWEFDERTRAVQLSTRGAADVAMPTFQISNGIIVDNQPVRVDNCGVYTGAALRSPNIMVAVFEGRNLRQLNDLPGGVYSKCGAVGSITYFHFANTFVQNRTSPADSIADDINTARRQGQLLQLLRNVPNGAYVALLSINKVNFSTFSPALKAELQAMGSQLIATAQDGDPLAMVLHKGFPADRREATFSPTDPTPRNQQLISLADTIRTREGQGKVTSTLIGPAQRWQTLYHTVKLPEPLADSDTLNLIGYTRSNTRVVLRRNVQPRNGSLALNTIVNAKDYPYLQLEMVLRDTTNRTAPQLKQWLVTYQGVPEGVVRRDHPAIPAGAYDAATLSAAAASTGVLNIPVYFENVSSVSFPALARAKAIVTETSTGRPDTVSIRATRAAGFSVRPGADSTAVYNFRLNVASVRGAGTIRIIANSQELPEQVYYNNELNLSFTAPNINVPPVLDVAFDGTRILNGDIVSPNPEVLVEVRYEDKRRPLVDPTKVQLLLTRPGGGVAEVVPMTNAALIRLVNDSTAGRTRVYYTPGTLPDGVYRLEVQAKDMGDNQVAAQRYGVTFEVVNKTSITNIFPYPNPITSKARFVFTLTGSTPPRNMKIQILTVTGKVVREIMQSELGPLRIGNNITEYAWDGTDEYGDRLANGTYLYRVVLDDPEGQYEHRRTAADQAFKKGWGKLVLLR